MRPLVLVVFFIYFLGVSTALDTININALIRDFWPADANGVCTSISKCGHNGLNQTFECNCFIHTFNFNDFFLGNSAPYTSCHRDFERFTGNGQTGAILVNLDADKKPVLNSNRTDLKYWSSASEFAQWYRGKNIVQIFSKLIQRYSWC